MKKTLLMPVVAFILFLLMQAVGVIIFMAASMVITGAINIQDQATFISTSLIISSVLSIIVMIWPMKMFMYKHDFKPSGIGAKYALLAILAYIIGTAGTNVLSALLDLPNIMEAQFNDMSMNVVGALAISVIAPIAEEVVFRGAILGYMLRKGMDFKKAILISALIFGIMHINPAQVPFAFVVGLMLGVIYYKTGNILLTSFVHILNNSFATVMTILGEDNGDTTTLAEELGATGVVIAIIASIAALAICARLLYTFYKKLPEIEYLEKVEKPAVIQEEPEKVIED
ncbi:MAG: CPBP family intramembrane metalloprotease [Bacteroidales bacterium]|nr:CPBP family intramembrane metalloprotease [Bacteroidales bacterium]